MAGGADGRRPRRREERGTGTRLPINWPALLSLFLGTVGAAYVLRFFPGSLLLGIVGWILGERGLRFANERPGRPGRALAWWGLGTCGIALAFGLAVAFQAHAVLTDVDRLRATLDALEASRPR